MQTMDEVLTDWVNEHIPTEGIARDVIDILAKRWGWTVLLGNEAEQYATQGDAQASTETTDL